MNHQEYIERIEAYLNDALSEDQRQELERRMATDEDFRNEVEFQRQMHEHFWDEERQHFREMVQGVMEENPAPQSPAPVKSRSSTLKWIALLAVLFIAGFFIWQWGKPSTPPPSGPIEPSLPKELELKQEDVPPKLEPTEKKPEENRPIAKVDLSNYVPNASMEALVHGGMMGEGIDLTITSPLNGTDFKSEKNGVTALHFTGTVEDMAEGDPTSFKLSVVNNVNKPIESIPFDLQKDASGKYRFDLLQRLNVPSGLYYFTLDDQAGNRVYTGKFTIGKYKK